MIRFLVDAQLPPSLALRLRDAGHAAEHVHEIGLGPATNDAIAERALLTDAVIVSKDADFVTLGRRSAALRVLWIRIGNTTSRELWRCLGPKLPEIVAVFEAGETIIEAR